MRNSNGRNRVIVGKREQSGKPFTEYTAPGGSVMRIWSPSVVKEAYRKAGTALDQAVAAIREDERRIKR